MTSWLIEKLRFFLRLDRQIYVGVSSLLALRGLQMALSFATMYVLTRALTKNDFGEYQFVLSVTGLMTVFALTGMGDAVMQAKTRNEAGVYEKARALCFLAAWLGSLAIAIAALWFWWREDANLAAGLAIAAILFPFANAITLWKNVLAGAQRFPRLARLEGVNALAVTGGTALAVLLWPGNFLIPIFLVLTIPALQNLNQTFRGDPAPLDQVPLIPTQPLKEICHEPYIVYGLKMSAYGLIGTVGMYLDRLLLFFFLSPAALATFVVAEKVTSLCGTAVKDVAAILAPRLAHHQYYTKRLDYAFTSFSVLFGLGVLFIAVVVVPLVIPLLFGPKYAESILYTQVLVASVALGNIAVLKIRFIQSRLDHDSIRRINLHTSLLRVGASLLLIPFFGIWGAIMSGYLYRIGTTILTSLEVRRHLPPPPLSPEERSSGPQSGD